MLKYKDINTNFLLKYKEINAGFFAKIQRFTYSFVAGPHSSKVCFVSYFFFTVVLMIIFFGMFHIGNETAFRR